MNGTKIVGKEKKTLVNKRLNSKVCVLQGGKNNRKKYLPMHPYEECIWAKVRNATHLSILILVYTTQSGVAIKRLRRIFGSHAVHSYPILWNQIQQPTCGQVNGMMLRRAPCLHGSTVYLFEFHPAEKSNIKNINAVILLRWLILIF